MPGTTYRTVIERGNTPANDRIIDYLKPRIGGGRWLDIGCNAGWLLSEVAGGVGLDGSEPLAAMARKRGAAVVLGRAEALPFAGGTFETAVLSCVLEQVPNWRQAFAEAARVARRVIGINPLPGRSPWGALQGWVRSVIAPQEMAALGCRVEAMDPQRYFFELDRRGG